MVTWKWNGVQVTKTIEDILKERLTQCAILVEGTIKRYIKNSVPRGRTYKIRSKGRTKKYRQLRPSSAPGQPPAIIWGTLWRSIIYEKARKVGNLLIARVGTNLKYGKFLELGTARIAPRPFVRPGLAMSRTQVLAILGRKI